MNDDEFAKALAGEAEGYVRRLKRGETRRVVDADGASLCWIRRRWRDGEIEVGPKGVRLEPLAGEDGEE